MKSIHKLSIVLFTLLTILFCACNKHYNDESESGDGKIKLHFGTVDLVQRDVRAQVATEAENHVNTVDVVFFQGQNKKNIVPTSGGNAVGYFHFEPTSLNDWENYSPTSQTVYIPARASDVNGTTAVALINLPDAVRQRLIVGATNEITTIEQLKDAVSQTIHTVEELTTPLLMTGESNVAFDNPNTQNNQINVNLKRAVSRLDVQLYYHWDKLIPNKERGLYTFLQFPGKTYVGAHAAIENRVDGTKTSIADLTAQPAPLVSTEPVPTSTLATAYINEYDLSGSTAADAPAPYILLELPAILGEGSPIAGLYPPPAGGDFSKTAVKSYYKIVLPRKIDRNCRYVLHAHIVGPGSPTPDGAVLLEFNVLVKPWGATTTVPEYDGSTKIEDR